MSPDDKTRIAPDTGVRRGVQLNGIYEIDEHLATGGMGEVYRGHNIQTGDPVAIKLVLREFARDQGILALFRKEASILNHLSHDAIVRYHVFTIDPTIGRPYLAMEFVDGQSLGERIRSGPLDSQQARKMLARVASGLAVAHEAGVIHRDLSPDNIVLPGGNVGKTKIIDFGIARSTGIGGGTLLGGSFAGKYNFVSPEQLGLFGGDVTERSDIYSLGLVLAAALRGEPLDMGGLPVEVIEKRRKVPDLEQIEPGLRPLLESMLQPDPKDREKSAAGIVEWLNATGKSTAAPSDRDQASHRPAAPWNSPAAVPEWNAGSPAVPPKDGLPPWRSAAIRDGERAQSPRREALGARPIPQQPKSGRGGLIGALVLTTLIIAAAAGSYYSGLFDSVFTGGRATDPGDKAGEKPKLLEPQKPEADVSVPPRGTGAEPSAPVDATELDQPEVTKDAALQPEPVKPISPAEWFASFDGGPCFYASMGDASADPPQIDGLATSRAPLDKLVRAYTAAYGGEPVVNQKIIERDQCPVADFLAAVLPESSSSPNLKLNKERLRTGDSLQGRLSGTANRDVNLLLVGKDGVVYNFANLLKKAGDDEATFSMKLYPLTDEQTAKAEPHLIVAFLSDNGIRSADIVDPELASDLFPKIRDELKAQPNKAGVAVGYFLFDH